MEDSTSSSQSNQVRLNERVSKSCAATIKRTELPFCFEGGCWCSQVRLSQQISIHSGSPCTSPVVKTLPCNMIGHDGWGCNAHADSGSKRLIAAYQCRCFTGSCRPASETSLGEEPMSEVDLLQDILANEWPITSSFMAKEVSERAMKPERAH